MITPNSGWSSRLQLVTHFENLLLKAASERDLRQDFVPAPGGGTEPAWVRHERTVMAEEVNRLRRARGSAPVETAQVERAENGASGHIDYVKKFALGCMELVSRP